jgi:branched-chain amino acid transport system substrate-binding protein
MKCRIFSKKTVLLLTLLHCRSLLFSSAAVAADTYKIGGIFSVTGPASFLGDPEKKSMEMAIDQINAAGGIDGRMLEAVIYDTEGDPQRAVQGITKLISKDNVIAIVGPSLHRLRWLSFPLRKGLSYL